MILNKLERVAKILDLALIPYSWLSHGKDGKYSLSLDDDSSTVSLTHDDKIRVFVSSNVSFSTFEEDDIGNALRIIMEVRYMLAVDGRPEESHSTEWIE